MELLRQNPECSLDMKYQGLESKGPTFNSQRRNRREILRFVVCLSDDACWIELREGLEQAGKETQIMCDIVQELTPHSISSLFHSTLSSHSRFVSKRPMDNYASVVFELPPLGD